MEMRMEIEMDGKQRAAEAIVALSGPGRALNSLPTPQGKCPASYTSCITADTYQNAGATTRRVDLAFGLQTFKLHPRQ